MAVPAFDYASVVLDLAALIPRGRVMTYGDIAEVVGARLGYGGPRHVGSVMSHYGGQAPWWRVVRADGRPPQGLGGEAWPHYLDEGTALRTGAASSVDYRVDLRRARWTPSDDALAEL